MGLLLEIRFENTDNNTVTVQLAYFGTNTYLNGMKNKMQNSIRLWQKFFERKIKLRYIQNTIRKTPTEFNELFKNSHNNEALMLAMLKTFKERKTCTDQLQTLQTKLMNLENEQSSLYSGRTVYLLKDCPFDMKDSSKMVSQGTIKISPTLDKFFQK